MTLYVWDTGFEDVVTSNPLILTTPDQTKQNNCALVAVYNSCDLIKGAQDKLKTTCEMRDAP